jgi:hypothetical protein
MHIKYLPLMASALASLFILSSAGCATSRSKTASSINCCAMTNTCPAMAMSNAPSGTTGLPGAVAERRRLSIEDFRKAKYPVDGRNFTPVDKNSAKLGIVKDDAEGSLNPYVLAIIGCYPMDGSYPYRCKPLEYDLYNGVTQDLWYKGRVVAKAHPNWTRCSYCCGLTFEVFVRAMQYRNIQKGLDPDDFNGMSFSDLFNLLQLWYIEGRGDSPQFGIESYGLGNRIEKLEDAKPGDFLDFSRNNKSGHSVIFVAWVRDDAGKITGFKYFSSNSGGVGYGTEYFEDTGGKVLHKYFRLARVNSVAGYRHFDRTTIPFRRAYAP